MSKNVKQLTDANFKDEVLGSQQPVLVDFSAEWCGPCKMLAPVLDEVAAEYQGRVVVGKLDVDANEQAAQRYKVRSVPTLLLFKNGQIVATQMGALTKAQLGAFLDGHL